MITELILNLFIEPLMTLIDKLPNITFTIPNDAFNTMDSLFATIGYIFPMATYIAIIGLKTSIKIAKVTIALIIRVKSFIPTMGS